LPACSGLGGCQSTGRWKIMSNRRSAIPPDSLLQLQQRFDRLTVVKYLPASETIFVTDNQEKTMRVEVMEHYGMTQFIEQTGAHHKQLVKHIRGQYAKDD